MRFWLILTFLLSAPVFAEEIFVVNEDDSHFYGSRTPGEMTREGLLAWVDQYAGTRVTHLFLCPNCKKADFDSKTREPIWESLGGQPDSRRPENAKRLNDAGLDPYAVWIARCREKGISPWITMRMNDVHCVNEPEHWIHSSFWREHPQYWLPNRGLNYAEPEVYEHNFSFVRELLERYDADGLELDWMRFCRLLPPGKERENAHVLTKFVTETRAMADEWEKKRGHEILISVRIPTVPETAEALGMNVTDWAKNGLIDWIVPSPEWSSADFDIPVGAWKERLAGTNVKVIPGFEHSMRALPSRPRTENDLASLYGWAETMRFHGADGLYLFNWMDSQTLPVRPEEYAEVLKNGLGVDFLRTVPVKRFPITFHDTTAGGVSSGAQLGKSLKDGGTFVVPHGCASGAGKPTVVLGIDGTNGKAAEVTLNGVRPIAYAWEDAAVKRIPCQTVRWYVFPENALISGANTVVASPSPEAEGLIHWVEIRLEPSGAGGEK